ncbi:MAG: HlyD family efflux transporter periplasmic adaptor subunit, partial [Dehalococcoidia bacterium]|nr:HlyD family efflux transporter periplasmic adaptor subunit [Dehalococcoidia bacterium]
MAGVFTQRVPNAAIAPSRTRTRKKGFGRGQIVVLLLFLIISIGAGYVGYGQLTKPAVTAPTSTTAPVRRGTITASLNLNGSVAAISQANLTFESAGRLVQLVVKAGDTVKEGASLARLDTADLELAVDQAAVSLEQAKLKRSDLLAGKDTATLQLSVDQATLALDLAKQKQSDLLAGPKSDALSTAEAAVRDAEVALVNAQDNRVITYKSNTISKDPRDRQFDHNYYEAQYGTTLAAFNKGQANQDDLDKAWSALLTAKEKLDSAKLAADVAARNADSAVTKAEDNLAKAKTALETLKAGPTTMDITAQEVAVRQAEATLSQRQLDLQNAGASATDIAAQEIAVRQAEATLAQKKLALQKSTLVAPYDGTVDSISANVGENVTTSKVIMAFINMQKFRVDARVGETDVGSLVVGQPAAITLEALTGQQLTAKVTTISAIPTIQQGVVNYLVTLELDPTKATVRPGMTASVVVETARRANVLLAPNRAVRTQGRTRIVDVMVDGKTETKTVTVGMSDSQFT